MLRRTLTFAALAGAAFPATASADHVWQLTEPLTTKRVSPAAVTLADGRALFVGGETATSELFNPGSGVWTPTASMTYSRAGATATTLPDGRVLVAGGTPSRRAEVYSPAANSWADAGLMNAERNWADSVLLSDGKVLLVGGSSSDRAEVWNPATSTWTQTGKLVHRRAQAQAVRLLNGSVLAAGGYGATSELFNPADLTWKAAADMGEKRNSPGLVTLPDGRALVAGGDDDFDTASSTSELYNPASGTWAPTGPLAHPHGGGSVMLTTVDGTPAMLGGHSYSDAWTHYYSSVSEFYDIASGRWTISVPLLGSRYEHAAAALPDGSIVIGGGWSTETVGERFVPLETAVGAPLINPLAPPAAPPAPPAAPAKGAVNFGLPLPRKLKVNGSTVTVKLRCSGGECRDKLLLKQWHTTLASSSFVVADGKTGTVKLKLTKKALRKLRHKQTSVSLEFSGSALTLFAKLRA